MFYLIEVSAATSPAATSPDTTKAAVFTTYNNVDTSLCDVTTLIISISTANNQPLSGHLMLYSNSSVSSTSLCNISLNSDAMASFTSQITSCNRSKFHLELDCFSGNHGKGFIGFLLGGKLD